MRWSKLKRGKIIKCLTGSGRVARLTFFWTFQKFIKFASTCRLSQRPACEYFFMFIWHSTNFFFICTKTQTEAKMTFSAKQNDWNMPRIRRRMTLLKRCSIWRLCFTSYSLAVQFSPNLERISWPLQCTKILFSWSSELMVVVRLTLHELIGSFCSRYISTKFRDHQQHATMQGNIHSKLAILR